MGGVGGSTLAGNGWGVGGGGLEGNAIVFLFGGIGGGGLLPPAPIVGVCIFSIDCSFCNDGGGVVGGVGGNLTEDGCLGGGGGGNGFFGIDGIVGNELPSGILE